jgi:hypothetical protein
MVQSEQPYQVAASLQSVRFGYGYSVKPSRTLRDKGLDDLGKLISVKARLLIQQSFKPK